MLCASCLELTTANCSQYSDSVAVFKLKLKTFLFSQAFSSLLSLLTNTLPGPSASEITTLWRYTNLFIIIIIIRSRVQCHIPWIRGPPSNTWFFGPHESISQSGISIGSAVLAQCTVVTNRDRSRGNSSPPRHYTLRSINVVYVLYTKFN